ncbi:MAG: adenylate kinase [Rubripirellula sp.]|nr:adenylate kinase [Rubripirellula sp.]
MATEGLLMQIVFIGPPGSGKGTQCEQLAKRYRIPHLSTGELLRRTKGKSTLGDLVASYIDRGCLAPDFLVLPLVMRLLEQDDFLAGCLFDGFPRTVYQAEFLRDHLSKIGQKVEAVIYLQVDESDLVDRLQRRSAIEGRADDDQKGILKRLEIYRQRTEPVLDFYRVAGLVTDIDGSKSPSDVHRQIVDCLTNRGS